MINMNRVITENMTGKDLTKAWGSSFSPDAGSHISIVCMANSYLICA